MPINVRNNSSRSSAKARADTHQMRGAASAAMAKTRSPRPGEQPSQGDKLEKMTSDFAKLTSHVTHLDNVIAGNEQKHRAELAASIAALRAEFIGSGKRSRDNSKIEADGERQERLRRRQWILDELGVTEGNVRYWVKKGYAVEGAGNLIDTASLKLPEKIRRHVAMKARTDTPLAQTLRLYEFTNRFVKTPVTK
jgi:hypothetical protein